MRALLEVVILPVSDPDLSLHFYRDLVGCDLDVDYAPAPDFRVVQLTPKGSITSIQFGVGLQDSPDGCVRGLYLVVPAPAVSSSTAVYVSAISGIRTPTAAGGEAFVRAPDPDRSDYASFADFSDPDGNGWVLQERGHGRKLK
jgi:catechol 2,3-dioxygenase-like lactoylglutathione lyase family enzyme